MASAAHGQMTSFDSSKETWSSYSERLDFYLTANKITDAKVKRAVFVTVIGARTYGLLKSLLQPKSPTDDDITLQRMKDVLAAHFNPKPSPITQRYKFHTRERHEGESVATYVAELRALGEHCDFGDTLDKMRRDRLVCGINNPRIQRRLLQEADLSYEVAFQKAQAMEVAALDVSKMSPQKPSQPSNPVHNFRNKPEPHRQRKIECYRCGAEHYANKCKFINVDCRACGEKGHLARVCRSKRDKPADSGKKDNPSDSRTPSKDRPDQPRQGHKGYKKHHPTHTLDSQPQPPSPVDSDEDYALFTLPSNTKPIVVSLKVNNTDLLMELDTGASFSIINETTYSSFTNAFPPLSPSTVILTTYTGEKITPLGMVDVEVSYQGQNVTLPLLIVPGKGPNLMGRNWLEHIKLNWSELHNVNCPLFSLGNVLKTHDAVFRSELGKLQGISAKLHIAPDARPRFFRPRPVALSLKEKVLNEISRLENLGVITPVKYSDWAAPIVPIVKEDGSIRLCGDYKVTINPVLLTDTYPLPRVDDLFAALSGGKIFSKLDLKHAYLQVPLDDSSKKYTTINTPKGLYQYERLPFGVSSAPSLFQRIMENLLSDLKHVCVYIDDILITGVDESDHLHNLQTVLQKLQEAGLTLKKSKCKFAVSSVEYLGHVIDSEGLHPAESKVRAIRDTPTPTNVTELKSFLGLLNYYHKFLPDLATQLAPLHNLLCQNAKWSWTCIHDEAFTQAKSLLHSSSLLVHYDENKPLIIACDASPYGVGAVLSHRMADGSELPVAYESRSLSPAEKKYSQLEKEALPVIFSVRKFHDYVYGRKFILYSDHKPLQYLLSESKQTPTHASSRIQRWALILSAYKYTIQYKPGKNLSHADALSRLPLPDCPTTVPMPQDVVSTLNYISESIISIAKIQQWTDKDPVLSRLRALVLSGGQLPTDVPEMKQYSHIFTELSVADGCLLRGSRVIIPLPGRSTILSQLHETHSGISRMKSLARCYVWWPGLDKDIEQTVKKCQVCQENGNFPPQTPVHPWECPKTPWTRIHIDHAGPFLDHHFLLIVDAYSRWLDAYSRWLEVHCVPSTSSSATIKVLRRVFSIHGLPQQLVSDNGPGFTSNEFKQFMDQNGIRHSLTSPYHPRSNGLVERAVQTFKQAMKKMDGPIHVKLSRFLFSYRITPQTTTGHSPAELLMGRRLRSRFDLSHPDSCTSLPKEPVQPTRSFKPGDLLFARNYSGTPLWIPVTVCKVAGPLTYHVVTAEGSVFKRHADQLK